MDWLDLVQTIGDHGLANGLDRNSPDMRPGLAGMAKLIERIVVSDSFNDVLGLYNRKLAT